MNFKQQINDRKVDLPLLVSSMIIALEKGFILKLMTAFLYELNKFPLLTE